MSSPSSSSAVPTGEVWRHVETAPGFPAIGGVQGIAVDRHDDVFAVGITSTASVSSRFTLVKLAAASGAVLWRKDFDGSVPVGEGTSVALDSAGNAFVGGATSEPGGGRVVAKLAGADGAALWRVPISTSADAMAATPSGDVVVAGLFTVRELAGADGAERWHTDLGLNVVLGSGVSPWTRRATSSSPSTQLNHAAQLHRWRGEAVRRRRRRAVVEGTHRGCRRRRALVVDPSRPFELLLRPRADTRGAVDRCPGRRRRHGRTPFEVARLGGEDGMPVWDRTGVVGAGCASS